jgi:hypothetical protein
MPWLRSREETRGQLDAQAATAKGLLDALAQRSAEPGESLRAWGAELAGQLLAAKQEQTGWTFLTLEGAPAEKKPVGHAGAAERGRTEGTTSLQPPARRATHRAAALRALCRADKLRFYLSGHDGEPGKPPQKKNAVRLRDADTQAVLREAAPPRNDTAQRTEWDLADLGHRNVYLEVADGDAGAAYAWLAIGRFKPELPQLSLADPGAQTARLALAATLARTLGLKNLAPQLAAVFAEQKNDPETRGEAARTLVALDVKGNEALLSKALADARESDALRGKIAAALGSVTSPSICQRVADALGSAPLPLQQTFASALSQNRCGVVVLLQAIDKGKATPTLLRDRALLDRLRASGAEEEDKQLAVLLAKLPPARLRGRQAHRRAQSRLRESQDRRTARSGRLHPELRYLPSTRRRRRAGWAAARWRR